MLVVFVNQFKWVNGLSLSMCNFDFPNKNDKMYRHIHKSNKKMRVENGEAHTHLANVHCTGGLNEPCLAKEFQ